MHGHVNIKYATDSIRGADRQNYMKTGNKERQGSRRLNWYEIKGKRKKGRTQNEIRNRSDMEKEQ
jgi:hypothetical protein